MTQRELAQQIGASDVSLSQWERGVCEPTTTKIIEIARVLRVTASELVDGDTAGDFVCVRDLSDADKDTVKQFAQFLYDKSCKK